MYVPTAAHAWARSRRENAWCVRGGTGRAGVCAGFAEYFDVDVTVVRLVWLFVSLMTGVGLLAYPIAWIVMPDEPLRLPAPAGAAQVTNP